MDVLGFEERGEGAGRWVRVRAKRDDEVLCQSLIFRYARTLTPTPLPEGEGLIVGSPARTKKHHFRGVEVR
jgi:hypothetical protein